MLIKEMERFKMEKASFAPGYLCFKEEFVGRKGEMERRIATDDEHPNQVRSGRLFPIGRTAEIDNWRADGFADPGIRSEAIGSSCSAKRERGIAM
jgi:hypothetical protein